jgi:hypothetical protein
VMKVQAPPATVFMQEPQCHIPTTRCLFILVLPQKEQAHSGMLAHFSFLHHFPEGNTTVGPIFADDPDFLGAFGDCHCEQGPSQGGRNSASSVL